MSYEFEVPEVIRLWDTLLADAERFEFLLYFCCALMMYARLCLVSGH